MTVRPNRSKEATATVRAIGELHFEGNIVPHSFYNRPELRNARGIAQHISIMILADVLYWYRPARQREEARDQHPKTTRKFSADKLQRSYAQYVELLGISKQQAVGAVKFLVDRGLLHREFRQIRTSDGNKLSNVMFVEPVVEAVKVLFDDYESGGACWSWVAEPPKPNQKKDKQGGIPNRQDTYPKYSGYLCGLSEGGIPNKRETNTETIPEISQEISQQREAAALSSLLDHIQEETDDQPPTEQSADAVLPVGSSPDLPQTSLVLPAWQVRQNGKPQSSQKVPAAGVVRRARKPQTTEEYLRRLFGTQFIDRLFSELQPLGVNREEHWPVLPLECVEELVAEAQRTHGEYRVKVPTRLRDLLDGECRRRNIPIQGNFNPVNPHLVSKYDHSQWSD